MAIVLLHGSTQSRLHPCIYSGVAELSIYVAAKHRGTGIGSTLLKAIISSTEEAGLWTLQGGIFPENTQSLSLLKKHGFKEVGRRERMGKTTYGDFAGNWRDVILVERRSAVAGIECKTSRLCHQSLISRNTSVSSQQGKNHLVMEASLINSYSLKSPSGLKPSRLRD